MFCGSYSQVKVSPITGSSKRPWPYMGTHTWGGGGGVIHMYILLFSSCLQCLFIFLYSEYGF